MFLLEMTRNEQRAETKVPVGLEPEMLFMVLS